jgi:hypothetical protein
MQQVVCSWNNALGVFNKRFEALFDALLAVKRRAAGKICIVLKFLRRFEVNRRLSEPGFNLLF